MKTNSKSSSMTASCSSTDSSFNGLGSKDFGRSCDNGGDEMRQANGAVVWGTRETCGLHGASKDVQVSASSAVPDRLSRRMHTHGGLSLFL